MMSSMEILRVARLAGLPGELRKRQGVPVGCLVRARGRADLEARLLIRSSDLIVRAVSTAPGSTDFRPERRQCDNYGDEKERCAQLDETKLLMAGGQEPFRDNARRSQHAVNEPIKHRALLVAVLDYVLR